MAQIGNNPFLQAAQQALAPAGGGGQFQVVLDVLDEFSQAIEQSTGNGLACLREPGFLTNLGQEYRIVVQTQRRGIEHILFRAHVPANGWPTTLDLYDEDLSECDGEPVLRAALLQFLQRPATRDVLRTLAAQ